MPEQLFQRENRVVEEQDESMDEVGEAGGDHQSDYPVEEWLISGI